MTSEQLLQLMKMSSVLCLSKIEGRPCGNSVCDCMVLKLCERVIGLQEALENSNGSICECEVFYNSPNSSYEGLVCERCISIAGALNRFGV